MPFDPVGAYTRGRQAGLAIEQQKAQLAIQQAKQVEINRARQRQVELGQVLESGDDKAIAKFVYRNPQLREQVAGAMGFVDELTRKKGVGAFGSASRLLKSGDADQAKQVLQNHVQYLKQQGQDPAEAVSMINQIDKDPKRAATTINLGIASQIGPEQYLKAVSDVDEVTDIHQVEGGVAGIRDDKSVFIPYAPGIKTKGQAEREEKERLRAVETDLKATETEFDRSGKLRAEYEKASGDFNKLSGAYERISAATVSPAGDIALIFNFMKMLDPGSSVMEGEFANAQNAAGVDARVLNQYNKLLRGERLNEDQRADFKNQAGNIHSAAKKTNKRVLKRIINIGSRFGVKKENILGTETRQEAPPAGQQQEGAAQAQKVGRFTVRTK